jgi:tRNA C32,U32 (ribose-2'-O)-methylase TrmJ
MRSFETLLKDMEVCVQTSKGDKEIGHKMADDVLVETALNPKMTRRQRKQIILLYNQVEKWYA